jgi:hypothetical protein
MKKSFGVLVKITLALLFVISVHDFLQKRTESEVISFNDMPGKYDASLSSLTSEKTFEEYIDHKYSLLPDEQKSPAAYAMLLGSLVSKRFYHAYLEYKPGNNFLAWAAARLRGTTWNEIWVADHILKSQGALCGQQSVVQMELLKRKGYPVRSVYFNDPQNGQHFALEAFYDNDWHFFDPDLAPDEQVLGKAGHPSIEKMGKDTALLIKAYAKRDHRKMVGLLTHYYYGQENSPVRSRVILFQQVTYWLSQSLWFLIMVYTLFFFKIRKRSLAVMMRLRLHKAAEILDLPYGQSTIKI